MGNLALLLKINMPTEQKVYVIDRNRFDQSIIDFSQDGIIFDIDRTRLTFKIKSKVIDTLEI